MNTLIQEKTNELCNALLTQPEMIALRQRIDTFMANDSARGRMMR